MQKIHPVSVHVLPARATRGEGRRFLRDLRPFVAGERPRLVLDCSEVEEVDDALIKLLLHSLEEAMKGNGNAKIAGVTQMSEAALRRAQLHRLFEMYPTAAAAVRSFSSYFGEEPFLVPTGIEIAASAETAA